MKQVAFGHLALTDYHLFLVPVCSYQMGISLFTLPHTTANANSSRQVAESLMFVHEVELEQLNRTPLKTDYKQSCALHHCHEVGDNKCLICILCIYDQFQNAQQVAEVVQTPNIAYIAVTLKVRYSSTECEIFILLQEPFEY